MTTAHFSYPPNPSVLQWLAGGQLANRFVRSLRLWVLLNQLYGKQWLQELPERFGYPEVRDRLFAPTHPKGDTLSAKEIISQCGDSRCLCHKRFQDWIPLPLEQWQEEVIHQTGFNKEELETFLIQHPFATVHRSLRDDLKLLSEQGWLESVGRGQYQRLPQSSLPTPSWQTDSFASSLPLSCEETWQLMKVLESIAFIQPNLEVTLQSLWEQLAQTVPNKSLGKAPTQRIFPHLDYILSASMQDRVDSYQEQLEELWRRREGGVIQFAYWIAKQERIVTVRVYPVCLHYMRRAKYLSAYGIDPDGNLAWHNYRLDRIASAQLTVFAWGDPNVPDILKQQRRRGELPTPDIVQRELEKAWGFNFYLPRERLIMRFPPQFARWYVEDTVRHSTFEAIAYQDLPALIEQEIESSQERQVLLELVKKRSPSDAYYCAWIRTGDINVLMRLRDWRPNGEVIAPLSLRQRLAEEASQELANYE